MLFFATFLLYLFPVPMVLPLLCSWSLSSLLSLMLAPLFSLMFFVSWKERKRLYKIIYIYIYIWGMFGRLRCRRCNWYSLKRRHSLQERQAHATGITGGKGEECEVIREKKGRKCNDNAIIITSSSFPRMTNQISNNAKQAPTADTFASGDSVSRWYRKHSVTIAAPSAAPCTHQNHYTNGITKWRDEG